MDKKLEKRIARLEKFLSKKNIKNESSEYDNTIPEHLDEMKFFDPELNNTIGFRKVYDIAKAATDFIWDQEAKMPNRGEGDSDYIEELKLASSLNPNNNPIFDKFLDSENINLNDYDSRTKRLLSTAIRKVLGKYATIHMKANGGRLSRVDRKSYFAKSKQEKYFKVSKNEDLDLEGNECLQDLDKIIESMEEFIDYWVYGIDDEDMEKLTSMIMNNFSDLRDHVIDLGDDY